MGDREYLCPHHADLMCIRSAKYTYLNGCSDTSRFLGYGAQHLHLIVFFSPIKMTMIGQAMLRTLWLMISKSANRKATPIKMIKIPSPLWHRQQQFDLAQDLSFSIT